jgi:hypothetical protein
MFLATGICVCATVAASKEAASITVTGSNRKSYPTSFAKVLDGRKQSILGAPQKDGVPVNGFSHRIRAF